MNEMCFLVALFALTLNFCGVFFSVNFPTMDLDRRGLIEIPSGRSLGR